MHITVTWDDDAQTTICWDFTPGWDWDDYRAAGLATQEMMQGHEGRVDFIRCINHTAVPGKDALTHFKTAMKQQLPNNVGVIAIVDGPAFMEALGQILNRTIGRQHGQLYFVETLDEARQLIAHDRAHTPT